MASSTRRRAHHPIGRIPRLHCLRCHHTWVPRREYEPMSCPHCCQRAWNKPYPDLNSPRVLPRNKAAALRCEHCRDLYRKGKP